MKKAFIIFISLLCLTGCNNKVNNEQENPQKESTNDVEPTCTKGKFKEKYKYYYLTKEECDKEGQSTAFFDITDNIDSRVFTINCDEIVDECGTTYYGVSYNIYDPDNSTREDGVVVVHY